MKRFYATATVEPGVAGGWAVKLDQRTLLTPGQRALTLPTRSMADAVAAEWLAQGARIEPASMPATGFANAAIDQISPPRESFVADIVRWGESDLLCYRADGPAPLVTRQTAEWGPLLEWARHRFDVRFTVTTGVLHQPQPSETIARLRSIIGAESDFVLAAFVRLAHLSRSLIITLALAENIATPDTLWAAACLDEHWQEENWGADDFAVKNRNDRSADFHAAARFLSLAKAVD